MDRTDIQRIWMDDEAIWIETKQGLRAYETFADYPRLKAANPSALKDYTLSFYGIHWPKLDEDLSFDGFFNKNVIPSTL